MLKTWSIVEFLRLMVTKTTLYIIYEKLDIAIANPQWINLFPNFKIHNFPIFGSDHGPVNHPEFKNLVKASWVCNFQGHPNHRFRTCANTFKLKAKTWGKNTFGNVTKKLRELQYQLSLVQENCLKNPLDNRWIE